MPRISLFSPICLSSHPRVPWTLVSFLSSQNFFLHSPQPALFYTCIQMYSPTQASSPSHSNSWSLHHYQRTQRSSKCQRQCLCKSLCLSSIVSCLTSLCLTSIVSCPQYSFCPEWYSYFYTFTLSLLKIFFLDIISRESFYDHIKNGHSPTSFQERTLQSIFLLYLF